MRRRSRTGGEVKKRRSKAATLKRSNAPKAVRRRGSSATSHQTEIARLTRELNEALEPAPKSGRSPKSRSSWLRTSPPRPSSPSRTRGCSMNCGNRWSSRRQRRMFFASSVRRLANSNRYSKPCWRTQFEFARPSTAICSSRTIICFT